MKITLVRFRTNLGVNFKYKQHLYIKEGFQCKKKASVKNGTIGGIHYSSMKTLSKNCQIRLPNYGQILKSLFKEENKLENRLENQMKQRKGILESISHLIYGPIHET